MSDLNTSFQWAQTPLPSDLAFYNLQSANIGPNLAVTLDTTNLIEGSGGNDGPAITLPTATQFPIPLGVTMETIYSPNAPAAPQAGASAGRVRTQGIAWVTSHGSVTAGTAVQMSSTASHLGQAETQSGSNPVLGVALNTTVDGDPLLIMVNIQPIG